MSEGTTDYKRIAKNTIMLYFRMFFMMGVNLYMSRVVLNTLGIEDFGIYNVTGGVVAMFSVLNNAMASATQRFLNFELGTRNISRLLSIFSTSINIHALTSILVLVVLETVGLWFLYSYINIPVERFSAAIWVYQFAVLSTLVVFIVSGMFVVISTYRIGCDMNERLFRV